MSNNQGYLKKVLKSNSIIDRDSHWALKETMFLLVPAILFAVW